MSVKLALKTILEGRYSIESTIGSGGMGTVYKAFDLELKRPVAIKLLDMKMSTPAAGEDAERFRREGKALSMLVHRNIVSVFRFGLWQDRIPFLVMEYVDGESLKQQIERDGPLPWTRALPLMLEVCEGLACAHSQGVIHRDVKPQNILVGVDHSMRVTKIVDFGLCRIQSGVLEADHAKLTQTGHLIGTPPYMAPEIARGEPLTTAVDVYALACVMHEVLTGSVLFDAATDVPAIIYMHCNVNPPSLRDKCPGYAWPAGLDDLLSACLAKQPEQRPSLAAVEDKLKSILASTPDTPVAAPHVGTRSATKPSRKFFVVTALAMACAIAAAVILKSAMTDKKIQDSTWKTSKSDEGYALLIEMRKLDKKNDRSGVNACYEKILQLPDRRNEEAKLEAILGLTNQYVGFRHQRGKDALKLTQKMPALIEGLKPDQKQEWQLHYLVQSQTIMYELKRYRECIDFCEKAIPLASKLPLGSDRRAEILALTYGHMSDSYVQLNQLDRAEAACRKEVEVLEKHEYPDDLKFTHLSESYISIFWILLRQKRYEDAEREIRREQQLIANMDSETIRADWARQLVGFVESYRSFNRYDLALKLADSCQQAINKCSEPQLETEGTLWKNRAFIANSLNDPKTAKRAAVNAIKFMEESKSPKSAEDLLELAPLLITLDQQQLADRALLSSIKIFDEPNNLLICVGRSAPNVQMGLRYLDRKDYANARKYLSYANTIVDRDQLQKTPMWFDAKRAWAKFLAATGSSNDAKKLEAEIAALEEKK